MCTPDPPKIEVPKVPNIQPPPRLQASEVFGRRRIRDDPRSRSGFTAATYQTPTGVATPNPNARRTLGGSIV